MDVELLKQIRTAIKVGDASQAMALIGDSNERLNFQTPFGTWLHVAASSGQLDLVKRLLDKGADVNAVGGTYKGGALNQAASEGHIEIVNYLIDAGADLDVSEPEKNPLWGAILDGHLAVVKLLVERGLDPHIKYTGEFMKNMDALAFARERGQKEIADYLATLRR